MVEASFTVMLPRANDFALTRQYLGKPETGLPAGDALYLAVANNHQATAISTASTKYTCGAWRIHKLPVSMGIRAR